MEQKEKGVSTFERFIEKHGNILLVVFCLVIAMVGWGTLKELISRITPEAMQQLTLLMNTEGGAEVFSAIFVLISIICLVTLAAYYLGKYIITGVSEWLEQRKKSTLVV